MLLIGTSWIDTLSSGEVSEVSNSISLISESVSFKYEETIRPIAKALLDIETIEDTDTMDTAALKSLLKYKIDRIEELEILLDKEKIKYHEKLEKERATFNRSIDFLKNQVELKDKRIDQLMDANVKLLDEFMNCPKRKC